MDLNTIETIVRPKSRSDLPVLSACDSWLAGGTWLFSEPQPHLSTLIDLNDLNWPALTHHAGGIDIAATCTIAAFEAMGAAATWRAAPLVAQCCRAFQASFKIWKTATVGGNLCLALPAGPLIALTVALDGVCTIWTPDGGTRKLAALDFVTGAQRTALGRGELLRAIDLPMSALQRRTACRQASLTPVGRSAALLIGTRGDHEAGFTLTVTGSTVRPIRLVFAKMPMSDDLHGAIDAGIPDAVWHTDVHGSLDWRKHMTRRLAVEIAQELGAEL